MTGIKPVMTNDPKSAVAPNVGRIAVATVFFVNGAVLASWVPHIPMVQMKLGLSPAVLGIALLGMAAGALMGIPLAGWWIPRARRPVGGRRAWARLLPA